MDPALGTRIVKLDIKDHNSTVGRNCNLFEGDVDWGKVRDELAKLEFTGWATAEVQGGDGERLREVAQRMDRGWGCNGRGGAVFGVSTFQSLQLLFFSFFQSTFEIWPQSLCSDRVAFFVGVLVIAGKPKSFLIPSDESWS